MKALVVDDHPMILEFVAESLRGLGVDVDPVADGASAALRLQETPYDLAIIDLGLPSVSGEELLVRISAGRVRRPFGLAVMSEAQNLVALSPGHGALLLAKPFDGDALRKVVEHAAALRSGVARRPIIVAGSGGWADAVIEAARRRGVVARAVSNASDALRSLCRENDPVLVLGPPLDAGEIVGLVVSARERGTATALVGLERTDPALAADLVELGASRVDRIPSALGWLVSEAISHAGAPSRRNARAGVRGTVHLVAGSVVIPATIVDVGEGGIGLLCKTSPATRDRVRILFADEAIALEAVGRVVWEREEQHGVRVGVSFDVLPDAIGDHVRAATADSSG